MPRKKLIRTNELPYHVTIRSNNKDWFELPMETMWFITQKSISYAQFRNPVSMDIFVLMQNHYHIILRTPNSDIDRFMFHLNTKLSKEIRNRTGRINRIFGDRYHWELIDNNFYYENALRYVAENPVRAGLVESYEKYPFHIINRNF
tara:strand:- start:56037 stop:56477 length:441 start_codon:yes stop_codon:yes gene_type:complete